MRVQAGRIVRALRPLSPCAVVDMLRSVSHTSVNDEQNPFRATAQHNRRCAFACKSALRGASATLSPFRHVVPFPAMKNLQSQLSDIFLFPSGGMAPPCRAMALDRSHALCARPPRPREGPPCILFLFFFPSFLFGGIIELHDKSTMWPVTSSN